MSQYYFKVPFATSGTKAAIPVDVQVDGSISYTEGYGIDYELPRDTDPDALPVDRDTFNQLMFAVTGALQQYQQHGVPEFITSADNGGSPYGYSKYAVVRYDNGSEVANYISKVDSNVDLPTVGASWSKMGLGQAYLDVAQTFTAVQTFGANGTPLVVDSGNSTALKVTLKDATVSRGGIGASGSFAVSAYLADLTTVAGGWDVSGNFLPGAAATYDVGSAASQFRAVYANRIAVLGNTAPTNGLYLPATNTPAIAVNSAIGVAFGAGSIGANTTQRHTLPAVTSDTIALLNATQTLSAKTLDATCVGVTATAGDNTTKLATTAFVQAATTGSSVAQSSIAGFLPSISNAGVTTAAITVSAGQAASSDATAYVTKATTTSWAVTNGNAINGYEGGTSLPTSSTVHFFACSGGSGTGIFASQSLTSPTLPSGYNSKFRRIFSIKTTAGGALIPYTPVEIYGGAIMCLLTTPVLDLNGSVTTTAALTTLTSLPQGIQLEATVNAISATASYAGVRVSSPSQPDIAPTISGSGGYNGTAPGFDFASTNVASGVMNLVKKVITDTSARIRLRSTATLTVQLVTNDFVDFRR